MKKKFLALLSLCMLCGCGGEEEKTFSLTTEEQQAYTAAIDGVMEEFYWEYDRASLSFSGATLPAEGEENARLFDASADCEYNLKKLWLSQETGKDTHCEFLHLCKAPFRAQRLCRFFHRP